METFIKNHSFTFERTLVYADTPTVGIDLTNAEEITILFRKQKGRVELRTATMTGGTVSRVAPYTSGNIKVVFNPSHTSNAEAADGGTVYEAIAVVQITDSDFDNSNADFAGLDNAFSLIA